MINISCGHIGAAILTVSLLMVHQAIGTVSDEDSSCSANVCDCLENSVDTLVALIERRIESSLLIQLDECATNVHNCDDNADCTDTVGSFMCTCQPGFQGDGITCTDIDECVTNNHNCDDNADCTNTVGNFMCQCGVGYDGDGITCTDINECDTGAADCVSEASCVNTIGSFTCTCPPERSDTSGREGEGCFAAASIPATCGQGEWFEVISLNLTDPQQSCPTNWTERTTPVRTCENPSTGCTAGFQVAVERPFTRVAGRAIGYQVGSPEAFARSIVITSLSVNDQYTEGLSVTYSQSSTSSTRNHIWTFAAGVSESEASPPVSRFKCPCLTGDVSPPNFVDENYFCESGNPTTSVSGLGFLDADPLWDGQDCEGECCSGSFATAPWFCTVTDNEVDSGAVIEVRNCQDESTSSENIAIEVLEIYIQ